MTLYNYITYLDYLNKKLEKFFEQQKPYIFCKKGCAKCCQHGNYPFSEIEFKFLMLGYKKLPEHIKNAVKNKILNLNEGKITFEGENFMYECPFLFDNSCILYEYRGIICRTFGLMYYREDGSSKVPFCGFEGLNYANVIDFEKKIISENKYKKLGHILEPLAYNVSYNFLTNKEHEAGYGVTFGARKTLLEWLIEEFNIQ